MVNINELFSSLILLLKQIPQDKDIVYSKINF